MKICPTCKETYKDEDLNFCLSDGTTLIKKRVGVTTRHSRLNEILAVVLLAVSVLIFLCLISYNQSDPTFNTASSQRVQNWIGVVGANLAEALFSAVGLVAYIFPALMALIAWRVFQSESLRPRLSQVIGFSLVVVSVSSLASLVGWHGGILGALVATYSVRLLSTVGAIVFLIALATTSILLISNFTLTWAFSHLEVAWGNLKIHYDEWKAKRREARSGEINLAKERGEKRRGAREEKALNDSPTISIPESRQTKATKAVELSAAAAAGTSVGVNPFETTPDLPEEAPPPSIAPSEKIPDTIISDDIPTSKSGSIPITPTKHTDELNPDIVTDESEGDEIIQLPKPVKSYDDYVLPSSQLLNPAAPHIEQKEKELLALADSLVEKTREFNVAGKVVNICPGPVVTTYEFKPDPGVKYSRVTGLVDDLCLALKAESVRIDRIPGKAFVGIEVPNNKRETIQLRDVIESKKFRESDSLMTIALGKTIDGLNYVTDLAKMPHLLIAGATGAGKSVGVNSLVVSILYKAKPDEVKFIMVDPKRLELGVYGDIPHLATPIITDPKRAAISLKWAVTEMERRYKDLAGYGVRNIDGYNAEAKRRNSMEMWDDNGEPHRTLPYIIIIIDELADLMMVSGREVEESITRLAQMARAVGIHLVLATQRPSVDVITGLIKANFPARISFRVSSKVDSRTIIDSNGAEGLLGKGDMLFLPPASSQVIRVHGAYVDEKEIGRIVDHIKAQGKPEYDTTITKSDDELDESGDLPGRRDPLFLDALKCVVNAKRGSTSLLQRHLRIGYGRAAAILDAMVKEGYIGDMDGSTRARPVLQKAYEDLQDLAEMESE
ncbi:MAG TPA: DNA translocase FtsK 4TM domain-containing protein [Pyrinomonadaceae bacterium]|nr:DNA translocase FtsK 4TM domain-containing protein [Pyrinomonadaceae bacterium]